MSEYSSLKATINANIKANNNQEITGQILNSVLNQMVTTLGAGYQFAGVATTATNPGTPDAKMFYIANGKGTYTNFGSLEVTEDEVVVLYWDTAWHKEATGIASQEKLSEFESNTDTIIKDTANKIKRVDYSYSGPDSKAYSFIAGETYIISYNSKNTVTLSTRNSPSGPMLELIASDVIGQGIVEFTPTQNASYLRCGNPVDISIVEKNSIYEELEQIRGIKTGIFNETIPNGQVRIITNTILKKGVCQALLKGISQSEMICYNSDYTEEKHFFLVNDKFTIVDIPQYTEHIILRRADQKAVEEDTPISLIILDSGYYSEEIERKTSVIDKKLDRFDINLYDGNYTDNSVYDSTGSIVSNNYWAIADPIDVEGNDGKKLYISNTYDAPTRYHLFELVNGAKIVVPCSLNYITIPNGAKIAHIALYKTNTQASSLIGAVISYSKIGEDVPKTGISGYLNETEIKKVSFPPSPQPNLHTTYSEIKSSDIYARWDALVDKFPTYITKTDMGLDASGTKHIYAYQMNFAKRPIYKIVWLCNQHGGSANGDHIMGALISAIMAEDLCGTGHRHNSWLNWLRNNVSINVMPCCNPWGLDNLQRTNYNGVNLNRNWDTSSWENYPTGQGTPDYKGPSAASEVETQYMVSFINSVNPDVVIDNHTLGGVDGAHDANSGMFIIGQPYIASNKAYLDCFSKYRDVFKSEYGMTLSNGYDNISQHLVPDAMNWIYEHNLYGGLIEMQWRDPLDSDAGFTSNIIEASYMLAFFIYKVYSLLLYK